MTKDRLCKLSEHLGSSWMMNVTCRYAWRLKRKVFGRLLKTGSKATGSDTLCQSVPLTRTSDWKRSVADHGPSNSRLPDRMTSWSIAPSLVVGHLSPFLWSDAAARDGRAVSNKHIHSELVNVSYYKFIRTQPIILTLLTFRPRNVNNVGIIGCVLVNF